MQPAGAVLDTQEVVHTFEQTASVCEGIEGMRLHRDDTRQTNFYDFAEDLLTELLPGWDAGLEDDLSDSEDDATPDAVVDPIPDAFLVDVSYLACAQEAERYLVQREGFSREDAVLEGLRQHLQAARDRAVRAVHREALRLVRPPGGPS